MIRRTAIVPAAIASIMTLSGCALITTVQQAAERGDVTNALGQQQVPPELLSYYEQKLHWTPCEDGLECATAKAPMNWENPGEHPDIELALIRQPARGQHTGSLFTNPGGPGASGYDLVASGDIFDREITRNYDVVGWDPRGVGRSSAVECLDDQGMDEWLYTTDPAVPPQNESDEAIIAQNVEAAKWYAEQCSKNTGPLLEFVDTISTVRDLDMLRALVGDPKLNYFGFSYGTDIGAHYVDMFPQNVGRIALDGATDPTLSRFDMALTQTEGFVNSLRNYLQSCLGEGATCPFRGSVDDAISQIKEIQETVDRQSITNQDGRVLRSDVIHTAIDSALYSQDSWQYLSDAFAGFMRNADPSGFFILADAYNGRESDGSYTGNMMEAFGAINCLDYPLITDQAKIAEFNRKLAQIDPLSKPGPEAMGDVTCENWPHQSRASSEPVSGRGADPVLVIGTTQDPATPFAWAESLSQQLESATLIRFEGEGHLAYPQKNNCLNGTVNAYFLEGTVPQEGTSC